MEILCAGMVMRNGSGSRREGKKDRGNQEREKERDVKCVNSSLR